MIEPTTDGGHAVRFLTRIVLAALVGPALAWGQSPPQVIAVARPLVPGDPKPPVPPVVGRATGVVDPGTAGGSGLPALAGPASGGLAVEKSAPATVTPGKAFAYEIIVRNGGASPLQGVRLEETLPGDARLLGSEPAAQVQGIRLTWELGQLPGGAERRFRLQVQPGEGDFRSSAVVTSSTTSALRIPSSAAPSSPPPPTASAKGPLSFTMTVAATARVGEAVPFTLQIANNSAQPLRRVIVRDRLPAGLQHAANSEYIEAELPDLAPGEKRTVPLQATATRVGRLVNVASVAAEGVEEVVSQATVEVTDAPAGRRPAEARPAEVRPAGLKNEAVAAASLTVEVAVRDDAIELGGETTYEIRVINQAATPAQEVQVVAVLPEGESLVAADGPTAKQLQGRQVTFDPIPKMAERGRVLYLVRVKGVKPGDWQFRVYVKSGGMLRPVVREVPTRVAGEAADGGLINMR